jgi:L-lactate dehydrogenase complex protein LldG
MNAREAVLMRLRNALSPTETDAQRHARLLQRLNSPSLGPVPAFNQDTEALWARFIRESQTQACTVERLASSKAVGAVIMGYLTDVGLPPEGVISPRLHPVFPWADWGFRLEARAAKDSDQLGITDAEYAIAETGSLLMRSAHDTPSSVSLLPPVHIVILFENQIVPFLETALNGLRTQKEDASWPRSVFLISGPSRTGDIEQTMVLGAHGPSKVHLIIIPGSQ